MEATVSYLLMLLKYVNIPKDFTINNMKKAGLKGIAEIFSVDFNDVLDTHKYLMKGTVI